MEIETDESISVVPEITLSESEKQLFDLLLEYIKAKDISVVIRSAGGWVRDKVLGKICHDIDLTLDTMKGEQFMIGLTKYLEEIGKDSLISGLGVIKCNPDKSKHLETVTFKLFGYDIDVSNLRSDEYADPLKAATAATKFGTPLEDALRRDLTINSMFYNINIGRIEDCTGYGIADLKNRIVRTPLDPIQTFTDDPLRILRAIRFATKYTFSIDPALIEAIKKEQIQAMLNNKVSRERIKQELTKILIDPNAEYGLRVIYENNLWPIVFQMPLKCADLENVEFYQQKQKESFNLAIEAARQANHFIDSSPILSVDFSKEDASLLFLMIAISFPFAEIYHKPQKGVPITLPQYLTFESLKFPDKYLKVCTIVTTACDSALFFKKVVRSPLTDSFNDIASIIRKQGNSWEMAFQIAAISDSISDEFGTSKALYETLLKFIKENELEKAYALKPLIDGKEIMKYFKLAKQGPEIGKIASNIFLWQCRNRTKPLESLLEEIALNDQSFK